MQGRGERVATKRGDCGGALRRQHEGSVNSGRKFSTIVVFTLACAVMFASAAQAWPHGPPRGPVAGEWSQPTNLGPPVNTVLVEQTPAISPDGLSLYWLCTRPASAGGGPCPGGLGGLDIWFSTRARAGDPWGPPQNPGPPLNTPYHEWMPDFSEDGRQLYFVSGRPGSFGGSDLWVSERSNKHDNFGWRTPVNLGSAVNTGYNERGPALFQEAGRTLLYFQSDRPGLGDFDIYMTALEKDKTFGPPVLVRQLSTPFLDQGVSVRRDGLELFISSDRPGGQGSHDLWVSTRNTTDSPWSTPVNLGSVVNSAFVDSGPEISSDGATLYFNSNRPGSLGFDLWSSTRDIARIRGR